MTRFAIFVSLLLPAAPVAVVMLGLRSDGASAWRGTSLWLYIAFWLVGLIAYAVIARNSADAPGRPKRPFLAYLTGATLPALFSGVWLFSAPYVHLGSLQIFAAACLIPGILCIGWIGKIQRQAVSASSVELALPAISGIVSLFVLGFATELLFSTDPFDGNQAESNADRSYWYIVTRLSPEGQNMANSFGFLGPEPSLNPDEPQILLIGDSMPAAGRPINFVGVAVRNLRAKQVGYDQYGQCCHGRVQRGANA